VLGNEGRVGAKVLECWRVHRKKQSQVANHTCSIQFNEIEGLERFGLTDRCSSETI
jgi:hypothetical protein